MNSINLIVAFDTRNTRYIHDKLPNTLHEIHNAYKI